MNKRNRMDHKTPRTDAASNNAAYIAGKTGTGALGMYGVMVEEMSTLEIALAERTRELEEGNATTFAAQAELMKTISHSQHMLSAAADNGMEFVEDDEGVTWARNLRAEAAERELEELRKKLDRFTRISESGESLGGELEEREARMAAERERDDAIRILKRMTGIILIETTI